MLMMKPCNLSYSSSESRGEKISFSLSLKNIAQQVRLTKKDKEIHQLSNDRAINSNLIHITFFLNCRSMSLLFSFYAHLILFFLCSHEEEKKKTIDYTSGKPCIRTQKKNEKMGCLSRVKLTTGVCDTTGSFLSMFLWHFLQRKKISFLLRRFFSSSFHALSLSPFNSTTNDKE
jgi:hypothetical protein